MELSEFEKTEKNEPNNYEIVSKKLNQYNNKIVSRTILEKNNSSSDSKNINTILISSDLIENCKASSKEGEYLKVKELPEISEEDFEDIRKNIIYDNKLEEYKNKILNTNYEITFYQNDDPISPIIIIEELIESHYDYDKNKKNEMINKYQMLNNYSYFRKIKGDGNCYYRAVIFKYIEMIILNKDIKLLRSLIYDIIFNCFYSINDKKNQKIKEFLKIGSEFEINTKYVGKILMTIYNSLKENKYEEAYKIFYISINMSRHFDMGIIFYFRYSLYSFIKDNEKKIYTQNFPILIGNLLPEEYEKEGDFNYEMFYNKYLLKMFNDAEKIIIYLTPFVLNINLDVFLYESEQNKNFESIKCPNLINENYIITTINRKSHYELLYSTIEYNKYEILKKYTSNGFAPKILKFVNIQTVNIENKTFNNIENENNNIENENNNIENKYNIENKNNIEKDNNNIENKNNFENENNNIENENIQTTNKNIDSQSSKYNLLDSSKINEGSDKNIYFSNELSSGKNKLHHESVYNSKSSTNRNKYSIEKKGMSIDNCDNENKEYYYNSSLKISIDSKQKDNINQKKEDKNLNMIEEEKDSIKSNKDLTDENNQKNEKSSINENDLNNNEITSKFENEIKSENLFVNGFNEEVKSNENYLNSNEFSKENTIKKNEFNAESYASKNNFSVNKDIVNSNNLNENSNLKNEESSYYNDNLLNKKYNSEMIEEKNESQINVKNNQMKSDFNPKNSKEDKNIEYYIKYIYCLKQDIKKMLKEGKDEENIHNFIKDKYKRKIEKCIKDIKTFDYKSIKEKVCINCDNNINKIIKLPCGCKICDEKCLVDFFTGFYSLEKINNYCCICSVDYSPNYLYQLGLIFKKNSFEKLLEQLINLFNKNIEKKCASCNNEFVNKKKIKIKYDNEETNILGDYNKLIHFLCENCFKKNNERKLNCEFCKIKHININQYK